ncbi:MAG: acetate--CoA ligase family protein [Deltaproteobacteria bacterium]|nr:acetate--CoA ligase family protein [Deltaproteobacteria bacterium]
MLKRAFKDILTAAEKQGWVMEPEAKQLLSMAGIAVPGCKWAQDEDEAVQFAGDIGYPVVAKVVSPRVVHKSDVGGVVAGIPDDAQLRDVFRGFSRMEAFAGVLVEEMLAGIELIAGGKMDYQFGPVVLLGIGGTEAEIYKDTSLRMAPLTEKDVASMVMGLRARALLEGYRGAGPIHLKKLSDLMIAFSNLMMDLEDHIASIDLNPVMCSPEGCVAADARIMLAGH